MYATAGPSSTTHTWRQQSNLTPPQRSLWLGQTLMPESPLYNMAFVFAIASEIEIEHFQAAFAALLQRCDALRTVIEVLDDVPQQRAIAPIDYAVPVLDFRNRSDIETGAESGIPEAVIAWAEARSRLPFKLSERLFDTALIQCDRQTVWYLNQHHLITDMVSLKRLYELMSEFYARSLAGTLSEAPDLPAYAEVSLPAPTSRTIGYWQQQQIQPSLLYHRSATQNSSGSGASRRVSFSLTPAQTAALKQLAIESEAAALTPQLSLFNLISGIVLTYVHRISDSSRVAFSTPAQGRSSAALRETIGVFIELFPLQVEIETEETFASLLAKISEASGHLLRHAQPGASEFAPNRDVNVVLNFLHAKISDFADYPVKAQWIHAGESDPHHHLRILVHDFDDRGYLQLHFDFNNDLFDPDLQERASSHFLALVEAILRDRYQLISQIDLLSKLEKFQLNELSQGPQSQGPQSRDPQSQGPQSRDPQSRDPQSQAPQLDITKTVVQQFEFQVEQTPDAIALICEGETLTYAQLNAQANQLARILRQKGLGLETPVGICLRRSLKMLVAIWGVLKAGGAYVPIGPDDSAKRSAHILHDTQAQLVIADSELVGRFQNSVVLNLDQINLNEQPAHDLPAHDLPAHDLNEPPAPSSLAYILYTSGSTGQPKGVEIEHQSLANYVQWAKQQYANNKPLTFALFSALTFDLTVTSLYVPLLSGGQIVIYPEEKDAIDLSLQRIFQDNAVDIIKLTPSHLSLVKGMRMGARLKALILGGENLKTSLAKEITSQSAADLMIYNEYGPTEATVGCMIAQFEPSATDLSVSVGVPAAGASIYLLDRHQNQVPLGDVGEIYIGGPGLARGYLNRPELTETRFVWRAGERLYRTGDLGRWEKTGKLSYLGRCDRQIKINGIRIELGEIEAALLSYPQIRHCVARTVRVEQTGATRLVCYYVRGGPVTTAELSVYLAQQLPSRIRIAGFIEIDTIPLTPNGKVDLAALPDFKDELERDRSTFVAPTSPQEETLTQIWQQVLSIERISTNDNFFELGGDSIMAIQIAARLSDSGWIISPNQVFQRATIRELAAAAKPKTDSSNRNSDKTDHNWQQKNMFEPVPLTKLSDRQMDKLSALLSQSDKEARS